MADVSGLVGRLPDCRLVGSRTRRLALALLGGRPGPEGGFARRGSGPRRARRRRVVPASDPRREAVAGRAGSLRGTGTGGPGPCPAGRRRPPSPRPFGGGRLKRRELTFRLPTGEDR